MTSTQIFNVVNNDARYKYDGKLNIKRILQEMGGAKFYSEMDPEFLSHMKDITGTANGFFVTENSIRLIINAKAAIEFENPPICSFDMLFDKTTGQCYGINSIMFISEMENPDNKDADFDITTTSNALDQITLALCASMSKAATLGYLQ